MGMAIGSETSGGVYDVYIHDNRHINTGGWSVALHVKVPNNRGAPIENIRYEHNYFTNTTVGMQIRQDNGGRFDPYPGEKPTTIKNVTFDGTTGGLTRMGGAFKCAN